MKDLYAIVIHHDSPALLLHCDDGDTMALKSLQEIVDGYIETVPTALAPNWGDEKAGRILLIINEEGKLRGLPLNIDATDLSALLDDVIVGNAVLMQEKGEKLIGFTKDKAENIVKRWHLYE